MIVQGSLLRCHILLNLVSAARAHVASGDCICSGEVCEMCVQCLSLACETLAAATAVAPSDAEGVAGFSVATSFWFVITGCYRISANDACA